MGQTGPGWRHSQATDQILAHQGLLVFHGDTRLMALSSLVEGDDAYRQSYSNTAKSLCFSDFNKLYAHRGQRAFGKGSFAAVPASLLGSRSSRPIWSALHAQRSDTGAQREGLPGSSFKAHAPNL